MNDDELINELKLQYQHVSICLTGSTVTIIAKPLKRKKHMRIAQIKDGKLCIKDKQMSQHCKRCLHSYWLDDFKHNRMVSYV